MDWNVFFSSLGQAVAGIVGIFAAFIITKIINNQADFGRKKTILKEMVNISQQYRDKTTTLHFEWYNAQVLELALGKLRGKKFYKSPDSPESAEHFYESVAGLQFIPRSEALESIKDLFDNPLPQKGVVYMRPDPNSNSVDEINEETGRIDSMLVEIKHHIRSSELFLSEISHNPESSSLVTYSIIATLILFFAGVIYPFSFLPLEPGMEILFSNLSGQAFFTILFSVKGLLLFIPSMIFSAIMLVFLVANTKLKYEPKDKTELTKANFLAYYSEHFEIMLENERQSESWRLRQFTSKKPTEDSPVLP